MRHFLPKSAGISPHISVCHLRITVRTLWVRSHVSARRISSDTCGLPLSPVSLVLAVFFRTQLIAGVANLYYTLLMLDSQEQVTRRTADKWKKSVEIMRAMKEAGMTTEAGVAQYEGTYYSILTSLSDLAHNIRQTENSLCSLLGRAPRAIGRGSLDAQQMPRELVVGIPVQMLSNRPDVRLRNSP